MKKKDNYNKMHKFYLSTYAFNRSLEILSFLLSTFSHRVTPYPDARILKPSSLELVTFAWRKDGTIVAPSNAHLLAYGHSQKRIKFDSITD